MPIVSNKNNEIKLGAAAPVQAAASTVATATATATALDAVAPSAAAAADDKDTKAQKSPIATFSAELKAEITKFLPELMQNVAGYIAADIDPMINELKEQLQQYPTATRSEFNRRMLNHFKQVKNVLENINTSHIDQLFLNIKQMLDFVMLNHNLYDRLPGIKQANCNFY